MIEQIRRANDRIEGEEISNKMFRLEQIVDKIFSQVEDHPEKTAGYPPTDELLSADDLEIIKFL